MRRTIEQEAMAAAVPAASTSTKSSLHYLSCNVRDTSHDDPFFWQ
jgi:hypothetical protein